MLAISQKLLDGASTINTKATTPAAFENSGCSSSVHTIQWGTSVSAGAVDILAADSADYSGTWATLATITYASGSPKSETFAVIGPYGAFRHQVSTAVVGGTVTTRIRGECS